ncbi:MAG: hypothetical protein M3014_14705, partial [Chloroflexota bacterium]|nr:hypothetical protein [Chloroflexota bacterium]
MSRATRTVEYSIGETKPVVGSQAVPTSTTRLAGVSRVHSNKLPSGPFCLHREQLPKPCPRRVRDGLSQTMIMEHTIDFQVFNRNKAEAVDYPAGMLVREVLHAPSSALMHTGYNAA